jgi:hypothetical protein
MKNKSPAQILKWLVLLLLFANGFFFAYARFAATPQGEPLQVHAPLNGDKLKLLSETPSEPAPAPAPAKPAVCLEWGFFAQLEPARRALEKLPLAPEQVAVRRHEENSGNFWVYIPPLRTREDAQKKLGEVRALGVEEGYILQDSSRWKNAISLGVFSNEDGAKRHLAALQAKGVRSAVAGARTHDTGQALLRINRGDDATMEAVVKLKLQFPATTVKAVECGK